jgi:hypothetical protein
MKTRELRPQLTVIDVICDVCGVSCRTPLDDYEYATLNATWGYHSRKDGQTDSLDLCENCFDDAVKYLKSQPSRSV